MFKGITVGLQIQKGEAKSEEAGEIKTKPHEDSFIYFFFVNIERKTNKQTNKKKSISAAIPESFLSEDSSAKFCQRVRFDQAAEMQNFCHLLEAPARITFRNRRRYSHGLLAGIGEGGRGGKPRH